MEHLVMKSICTIGYFMIGAALLAAFALAQVDDSKEQKGAELEYCEMVEMGAWGSYKPEIDCVRVMGDMRL